MESREIADLVADRTGGRPYALVLMSYQHRYALYQTIAAELHEHTGLLCLRADDFPSSGQDLLAKIHYLIEHATLVIAEVSDESPNVYYEIGYAMALKRPVLFVAEDRVKIPIDLAGREMIRHSDKREAMAAFTAELRAQAAILTEARVPHLRDMLEPAESGPVFIAASPKYPRPDQPSSRILGQQLDRRTFGDNLGIAGLLSAYGQTRGGAQVELISAHYCTPDLPDRRATLCLIGSDKSNPLTERLLPVVQGGSEPQWRFAPLPGKSRSDDDWHVGLYRAGQPDPVAGESVEHGLPGGIVHRTDYGLLIRAPHPQHRGQLVLVMAGPHSLGTGAACLTATRRALLVQVRHCLKAELGLELNDKAAAFYVLVKGVADDEGMLREEDVSIEEVGRLVGPALIDARI